MEKNITVVKTVTEEYPANRAKISITLVGEDKRYEDAVKAANEKCAAVTPALKRAEGVKLSGGGVSVVAVRSDKKIIYRASSRLFAETKADGAVIQRVIDALSESTAEWSISFSYVPARGNALLKRAVSAARVDAEDIASAAGVKLGALASVKYSSGENNRPMLLRAARFDADNIEPEVITLSETVECSWAIE